MKPTLSQSSQSVSQFRAVVSEHPLIITCEVPCPTSHSADNYEEEEEEAREEEDEKEEDCQFAARALQISMGKARSWRIHSFIHHW